jgi:DNA-binding IclR family transcriptional regulator
MSQAATKALDLVEVVARAAARGITSTEVTVAAGLDKTTVSRLLRMLTDSEWLVRDPVSRRYFPGRVLIEIAHATGFSQRTRVVVNEVLQPLADASGETVALHQLAGQVRLCIAGIESAHEVRSVLHVDETRPLDRGASSRLILAFCDPAIRDSVLDEQARQERELLTEQLAFVEAHGYLDVESDASSGSGAIAVPVFDGDAIFGSLAVAGPAYRFTAGHRLQLLPAMFAAAERVSQTIAAPSERYSAWSQREGRQ